MSTPVSHLIIAGLPKAANVFFQKTMEMTLGCTFVRFASPQQSILPDKFTEFFALDRAVGGQHIPPSEHNLQLMAARNVRKVAILVRDPRDAVVSGWHHLERPDIKADSNWVRMAAAGGAMSPNYYDLGSQEKLRDLAVHLLPLFQAWVAAWLHVADNSSTLECHISRFEDFVVDQRGAVRAMLAFFGHDVDPVLPTVDDKPAGGIHAATHFRRGQVGSYRDEASPELVQLFDEQLDRNLARRMGWS